MSAVILRKAGTCINKQTQFFAQPVKERNFSNPFGWNTKEVRKYAGKALRKAFDEAQALMWDNPSEDLIRATSAFTQ